MTDDEKKIYQDFIDYVSNPIVGFTESEHMMSMITSHISPEDAVFLTGFPLSPKTLEEIAEIKEMSPDEVLAKIKPLANKAIIYESIRGDSTRYTLFSIIEMFLRPFHIDREEESFKKMAHHRNKYFMDGWHSQVKDFPHPGLRALPINETIEDGSTILPYEDVLKVVENYEYFSVSQCACRTLHKHDKDFEESPFPSNVCLHFDEFGRFFDANGLGKPITREETFKILKEAADAGLVHGLSDIQEGAPGVICNCDLEYCVFFKPFHQLGFAKSIDKSNYVVEVTPETCKACGLCVKRCPMDAIQMKFSTKSTNKFRKAVVVDADLCIGCGVCVHKCKPKSITLKRKDEKEITEPPKNSKDMMIRNVTAVMAAKAKQK